MSVDLDNGLPAVLFWIVVCAMVLWPILRGSRAQWARIAKTRRDIRELEKERDARRAPARAAPEPARPASRDEGIVVRFVDRGAP